jgi:hypothetical protein
MDSTRSKLPRISGASILPHAEGPAARSFIVPLIIIIISTSNNASAQAPAKPAPPVLVVRLVRPDRQLERVLALFEGSGAAHPAAMLAAWRRAAGRADVLGMAPQAVIAALNPENVRELRTLDGATFRLAYDENQKPHWSMLIPEDDGAFAAFVTAAALTDGAPEPPLEGTSAAVDRLGPPGWPLAARHGRALVLGASRDDLRDALATLADPNASRDPTPPPDLPSGWVARLEADGLARAARPELRQVAGALRGLGIARIDLAGALVAEQLDIEARPAGDLAWRDAAPAVELAWLDALPASPSLAFAVALDPKGRTLDALFRAADGATLPDPAGNPTASWRSRLNILANLQGVRPEVELWPRLRGLSGGVAFAPDRSIASAVLALHARDADAAEALAGRVVPRLLRAVRTSAPDAPAARLQRRDTMVVITWGTDAPVPAAPDLRAIVEHDPSAHLVAAWPSRLPWLGIRADSPLDRALRDAPPLVWSGNAGADLPRERITWTGLRATVRRLVAALPQAPPAEHAP